MPEGGDALKDVEEPLLHPSPQRHPGFEPTYSGSDATPEEVPPGIKEAFHRGSRADQHVPQGRCTWLQTTSALLTLQLGWGLWLFPSDFARLGWVPGAGCLVALALLTTYSGFLFSRLYLYTPGAVLLGDIGEAAAGNWGRSTVYGIIYSLDATRCVILHLAAAQSLRHIFDADSFPPLWQCGLLVLVLAGILVQIRSLAELSWVFMTGTISQLVAIGIVMAELIMHPDADAETEAVGVHDGTYVASAVALMNMIFAFGGQFAFIEIMSSMATPRQFPRAVTICTVVMACLYGGVGAVGYWSRGNAIKEIVIFSLGSSMLSRLASACILVQALAQYLVNLNVWTHNLLVLIARNEGSGHEHIKCSTDHCRRRWAVASIFVVAYSFGISTTVPYFSTLVGLVTSVTYLVCAYVLPAWFTLKLMSEMLPTWEKALLWSLIPMALVFSAVGLYASVAALLDDISGGEGGWTASTDKTSVAQALFQLLKLH